MSESESVCVNCGSAVQTPYCGQCGQQNPPKQVNFRMLVGEFQRRIYGFDGTFPRTVRDLTLVPGEVARQFLNGNRVRYVGPVGYFFLVLTIFLLTMQILEIDLYALSTSSAPINVEETERQKIVSKRLIEIFQNNMRTFSFLQIPISALFAWLFFRKHRYNYLENSVLVFYTSGHLMWLSVINLFIFLLAGWNFSMWQVLINAGFYGFACVDFYVQGSKVARFIKGILVAVTSYIFFMILGMLAAIVYLFANPEMMEMLRKTKG
jgi:hypothetical protein